MDDQPQPWDTGKATQAFADAHELVLALTDSLGIAEYQRSLQALVERRLESADDMDDFTNRLAYVIYGFTAFGACALSSLEMTGSSREQALSAIGKYYDNFLRANGF